MSKRRSPYRHKVGSHTRGGNPVREYERGLGNPTRSLPYRSVNPVEEEGFGLGEEVTGESPVGEGSYIEHPISAMLIESKQKLYDYDIDAEVRRPVVFEMVFRTTDDPYGYEDEEWAAVARTIFGAYDNTINAGYTAKKVDIYKSQMEPGVVRVTVRLGKETQELM